LCVMPWKYRACFGLTERLWRGLWGLRATHKF
jgi:hypothetical protein